MSRKPLLSNQDWKFYGLMTGLAGLIINAAPGFNKLPFPYPLFGVISPFLVLAMMLLWTVYYTPKRVHRHKPRTKRKVSR